MKDMTIHEVASLYGMSDSELLSLLSTEVDIEITPNTLLRTLHDEHGLTMSTVKLLLESNSTVASEVSNTEGIALQSKETIREYLAQYYFQYLGIALFFASILFFLNKKSKKLVKWINIILIYILLPLFGILWPIYL
jgi:hypothetical protein